MSQQKPEQNGTDRVGKICDRCGDRYLCTAWEGPGRRARRSCGCRVAVVCTTVEHAETCAEASQQRAEQLRTDGGRDEIDGPDHDGEAIIDLFESGIPSQVNGNYDVDDLGDGRIVVQWWYNDTEAEE